MRPANAVLRTVSPPSVWTCVRAISMSNPVIPLSEIQRVRPLREPRVASGDRLALSILCVEDHADTCEMLAELLKLEGYEVETAMSIGAGRSALDRRSFDLVITDYALPDGTGTEMLFAARDDGALGTAGLVLFTAHPEPALIDGATLIRKPLAVDSFLKTISEVLEPARAAALEKARQERRDSSSIRALIVAPRARVEFVLYVSSSSLASQRAVRAMDQLLLAYEPDEVRFTVIDLATGSSRSADEDRVVFTPTLVQRFPAPKARILGDLTNVQVVIDLLENAGVRRRPEE